MDHDVRGSAGQWVGWEPGSRVGGRDGAHVGDASRKSNWQSWRQHLSGSKHRRLVGEL